jgi:hypothetical protein
MSRRVTLIACFAGALAPWWAAAVGSAGAADEVFAPTAAVTIPGVPMASWDISFVDPTLGQFFLGDRTHNAVDVVNTGSSLGFAGFIGQGLFTGVVPAATCTGRGGGGNDCNGPDGVLVTNHTELWVGDGNSTVKVFDLTNPAHPLTHTISTGGKFRADEMCFNPEQQLLMVANNSEGETPSPFATIISVKHHAVVKRINFDGTNGAPLATNGAEQCQYSSRTERFYITLPGVHNPDDGTGVVVVINPEDLDHGKAVEKVFPLANTVCDTPQGMAVGPDHQLLVGCNGSTHSTNAVVIDQRNGAVLAAVPNESGPDMVWYNPGDGHYFLARSAAHDDAAHTQKLGVIDARGLRADMSVFTANGPSPPAPGSHSVAADPVTNQVYVATGGGASTVCGTGGGSNAQGCIAVFTTKNDDQCLAEGAPVRTASAGEDPVFMNGRCRDHDRHDHDHDHDH